MLSLQAACSAPITMMSRNRLSEVDRERALADDRVNPRAEAEIALLQEKVDLVRERESLDLTGLLRAALDRLQAIAAREASA